jgi:hypothetical protein
MPSKRDRLIVDLQLKLALDAFVIPNKKVNFAKAIFDCFNQIGIVASSIKDDNCEDFENLIQIMTMLTRILDQEELFEDKFNHERVNFNEFKRHYQFVEDKGWLDLSLTLQRISLYCFPNGNIKNSKKLTSSSSNNVTQSSHSILMLQTASPYCGFQKLNDEDIEEIRNLIDTLHKEYNSYWPYPNKDLKLLKKQFLTDLLDKCLAGTNFSDALIELKNKYDYKKVLAGDRIFDLVNKIAPNSVKQILQDNEKASIANERKSLLQKN